MDAQKIVAGHHWTDDAENPFDCTLADVINIYGEASAKALDIVGFLETSDGHTLRCDPSMTAGHQTRFLAGLLYGSYANVVIYGDISGDNHWMGRAIVIMWDTHTDWQKRERWDFARESIATPTYIRDVLKQHDYLSHEHNTDTVRVMRIDGRWQKMTRVEAVSLVIKNDWPTNANNQPKRTPTL